MKRRRTLTLILATALISGAFLYGPVAGEAKKAGAALCADEGPRAQAIYMPGGRRVKKAKKKIRRWVADATSVLSGVLDQDLKWNCNQHGKPRVKRVWMDYVQPDAGSIYNIRKSLELRRYDNPERLYVVFAGRFQGNDARWLGGVSVGPSPPGLVTSSPIAALHRVAWGLKRSTAYEIVGALGVTDNNGTNFFSLKKPRRWYDPTFAEDGDGLECFYRPYGSEWCNVAFSPFLTRLDNQPCDWQRQFITLPHGTVLEGRPLCLAEPPAPEPDQIP